MCIDPTRIAGPLHQLSRPCCVIQTSLLQESGGDAMAISRHSSKAGQQSAGALGDRGAAGPGGSAAQGPGQGVQVKDEPPYEHLLASMSLDK